MFFIRYHIYTDEEYKLVYSISKYCSVFGLLIIMILPTFIMKITLCCLVLITNVRFQIISLIFSVSQFLISCFRLFFPKKLIGFLF